MTNRASAHVSEVMEGENCRKQRAKENCYLMFQKQEVTPAGILSRMGCAPLKG
ncbi:hypothetical protein ACVW0A_002989 [Pseudomonas sp. TE3610]